MRVAAFQRFPIFDDPMRAGEVLQRDLAWADQQGVDIAVFPEAFLQGHSYDRRDVGRRALRIDDPVVQRLASGTSAIGTTAIVGFFERRGEAIFNSAMVVEAGHVTGVYAKAYPIEDGCTPGGDWPVFRRGACTYGIAICNDLNYPDAAARLTPQGATLICCPLNMMLRSKKADLWRGPALDNLQACARRAQCWLAAADVAGHRADGWLSYGCTAILRPDGTVAERGAELVECAIIVDLP